LVREKKKSSYSLDPGGEKGCLCPQRGGCGLQQEKTLIAVNGGNQRGQRPSVTKEKKRKKLQLHVLKGLTRRRRENRSRNTKCAPTGLEKGGRANLSIHNASPTRVNNNTRRRRGEGGRLFVDRVSTSRGRKKTEDNGGVQR